MSGGALFVLIVLFVVWLLLVRPQRRRRQAQEAMIDRLRPGDEVLTAGGLYAHVLRVAEDEATVELSPGVEARLDKRAIAAVFPADEGVGDAAAEREAESAGATLPSGPASSASPGQR